MHPWMRTQPPPPTKKPSSTTGLQQAQRTSKMFQPPPSYEKDHDSAMKGGVKTVDEDELFRSISGNAKVTMESVEREDQEEDVMATKWGNDVFQMVEEDDLSSDDESVDEDTLDASNDMETSADVKKTGAGSSNSMQNTMHTINTTVTEHSEMSQEEEVIRSKRFKKMSQKKSAENGLTLSQAEMLDKVPSLTKSNPDESGKTATKDSGRARSEKSPMRSGKQGSHRDNDDDLENSVANQLTMDEFGAMMDTLALQPTKKATSLNRRLYRLSSLL